MKIKKIISLWTLIAFLCTGVMPQAMAQQQAMAPAELASLHLPESLATVETRFAGRDPRFVLIMQDVHANYGAQKNFVQVMESLEVGPTAQQFRLLALEGASSPIDTAFFQSAKNKELRDSICDDFMRKGYLSGADYYLIRAQGKAKGVGVEDLALYKENLDLFRKCFEWKPALEITLAGLRRSVGDMQKILWPKDVHVWNARQRAFDAGTMKFTQYCRELGADMTASGMDTAAYPNLGKAMRLAQWEAEYDASKVQEEKQNLVEKLQNFGSAKDKQHLVEQVLLFKLGKISSWEFYSFLLDCAAKHGAEAGPNLQKFARSAQLMGELNLADVQKEGHAALAAMKEKALTNERQKDLDGLDRYMQAAQRLVSLSLSRGEWEQFQTLKRQWTGERMADFLKDVNTDVSLSSLPERLEKIEEFYRIAEKRDKVLLDNTLSAMDKEKSNTVVLIVGGFHGKGIAEALKQQGISHMIATCRVDGKAQEGDEVYLERMLGKKVPARKLASNLQMPDLLGNEAAPEIQPAREKMRTEFNEKYSRAALATLRDYLSKPGQEVPPLGDVLKELKQLDGEAMALALDEVLLFMAKTPNVSPTMEWKGKEEAVREILDVIAGKGDARIASQSRHLARLLEPSGFSNTASRQSEPLAEDIPPWALAGGYVVDEGLDAAKERYAHFEMPVAGQASAMRILPESMIRHYANQPLQFLTFIRELLGELASDEQQVLLEKKRDSILKHLNRIIDFVNYLEAFEADGKSYVMLGADSKKKLLSMRDLAKSSRKYLDEGKPTALATDLSRMIATSQALKQSFEPISMVFALQAAASGDASPIRHQQHLPTEAMQPLIDALLQGPFEDPKGEVSGEELRAGYADFLDRNQESFALLISRTLRRMSRDNVLPDMKDAVIELAYKGAGKFKRISAMRITTADGQIFDFGFVMSNLRDQILYAKNKLDERVRHEQWVLKQAIENYENADEAMREADPGKGLLFAADANKGMMTVVLERGERLPQETGSFEQMFEAYLRFYKDHDIAVFDMKPDNVVSENGVPRVADFDSASERHEFTNVAGYLAQLLIGLALTSSPTPSPSGDISRFFPSPLIIRSLLDAENDFAVRALWNAMQRVFGKDEIDNSVRMLHEIAKGLDADQAKVEKLAAALEQLNRDADKEEMMRTVPSEKFSAETVKPASKDPIPVFAIASSSAPSMPALPPASGQAGLRGTDTEKPSAFIDRDALNSVSAKELLADQGGLDALVNNILERDGATGLITHARTKLSPDKQSLQWTYTLKGQKEKTVIIDLFAATREQNAGNHATILPDLPGVPAGERRAVALSYDLFNLPPGELRAHLGHEITEIMGLPHPFGVVIGGKTAMKTSVQRAIRMLLNGPENQRESWAKLILEYSRPDWQPDPERRENDKVTLQATLRLDQAEAERVMGIIDAERAALAKSVSDMLHEEAAAISIKEGMGGSGSVAAGEALNDWVDAQIGKDKQSASFAKLAAALIAGIHKQRKAFVEEQAKNMRAAQQADATALQETGLLLDFDAVFDISSGKPALRQHVSDKVAFYQAMAKNGLLAIAVKDNAYSPDEIRQLFVDELIVLTAPEIEMTKIAGGKSMAEAAQVLAKKAMSKNAKTPVEKIAMVIAEGNQDYWEVAAAKEFLYALMDTKTGSVTLSGNMLNAATTLKDPALTEALKDAMRMAGGKGNTIQVFEETTPSVDAAITMLRSVRAQA